MVLQKPRSQPRKPRLSQWFERGMALIAVANLGIVLFDLTYVPWRNFWLLGRVVVPFTDIRLTFPLPTMDCPDRSVDPGQPDRWLQKSVVTCLYDPIKGIEPHRDTQHYLTTVRRLETQVQAAGLSGTANADAIRATLKDLQQQSIDLIDSNPFEPIGRSGNLEKIKNRVRQRIKGGSDREVSAKEAFKQFWSPTHLTAETWATEMAWFNQTIAPTLQANYYRKISENSEFTDLFWLIDLPFTLLFATEFLARTFYISRRFTSLSWLDAMIWRWYDIPLFIPFSLFFPWLALLRVIPTTRRLHQADLLDLSQVHSMARQGFVAAIAEEMTEVVVVQVINQLQAAVKSGDIMRWVERSGSRRYIDLNNVNEIEAIAQHLIQLTVYQVFPQIRPDLEGLVRHTIDSVLDQSPAYKSLKQVPGLGQVPLQITEQLVTAITQTTYDSLKAALEDPETTQLTTQLLQNFGNTLLSEAQQQNTLQSLQTLVTDLLEEIKINYIQGLAEEDIALLMEETRQIQKLGQKS